MDMDVGLKQGHGLFYNIARTLGPRQPFGQFAIDRVALGEGFFFCPVDCTTLVPEPEITMNFWNNHA